TPGMAVYLIDAYRWADDSVNCAAPTGLSDLVMEDVQGKKIVFRDGWDPKSTYMLLNYRDEGMGGWRDRNYLRATIPVEEEKMTHGHADENGIGQLMWRGSLLLTDAGYRDFMPSGQYGAFRQDYFHNRMCVRQEKMWMGQKAGEFRYSTRDSVPGQPVLDFLRNSGAYRKVQTQLVEFFPTAEWDVSRTRLIDAKLGYQWERVVNYVKDPEMFVIFDVVQADLEEYFTAANLWHTRQIEAQGKNWYLTSYDSLRTLPLKADNKLLIYFPESEFKVNGVETSFRNHQNELTIHQTASRHFYVGDQVVFTTVLVPMTASDSPEEWVSKIESMNLADGANGVAVQIQTEKGSLIVGAKP
ncbi:heparinase II/III family protein, partial [bacterium]|nr:heparinase II/III family protein [bacterium]